MFRNYLKTAIRNFLRDKGYSLINVLGLAVGMSCALLIGLYIWDELRYDDFHKKENLFRVALHRTFPANENYYASTPAPIAEVLTKEYAEVQSATRLFRPFGETRVRLNDDIYFEPRVLAADSNFFDIFNIRLLWGNAEEALRNKNSVILTASTARKYFGKEEALGKQLFIFSDTTSYLVTGITEDVPSNCHFTYDMLLSFVTFRVSESNSWASYNCYNYVVLDAASSKTGLEEKFPALVEQYFGPEVENILGKKYAEYFAAGNRHNYHLQPIRDIHLHSNYQQELKANGDIRYVYLFASVLFFILFVAAVNFTNLSTARSFRRSREIGVRKVHGSLKRQIIFQFLSESLLITFFALTLAGVLVAIILPAFNEFTSKQIRFEDLNVWGSMAVLAALLLTNGILAGIYPAFIVSSFEPVSILKGGIQSGGSKSVLRSVLVVGQFGVSIVLIISTLVIYRQISYMRDKKLGFDKDRLLIIERANSMRTQRTAFDEELRLLPGVRAVGTAFSVPGRQYSGSTFQAIGAEATERINHLYTFGDYDLPTAMGVEIIAGRTFSEDIAGDSAAVVVNEALVKRVGWKSPEAALGNKIRTVFNLQAQYEIIGVVRDFNFESLRSAINPMAFYGSDKESLNPTMSIVNVQAGANTEDVLKSIAQTWKKFLPGEEFEYVFMDEEFDNLYRQEESFGKIFTLFSGLAIFIAAIGVIGLSTFMASQRTKEIGIRKVNGASVPGLLLLLSRDFVKLVVIANLVFWPIAWYGLSKWLDNYPFRTDLSFSLFVLTGILTAVIVILSVVWQSMKAAMANPVKSLRSE